MTIWKTIRRIYEPYKASPGWTMVLIIRLFYTMGYSLFSVKYFQIAVSSIEKNDYATLKYYTTIYLIYTIFIFSVKVPEKLIVFKAIKEYGVHLDIKYLKNLIESNNKEVEQIGTGRMHHIIKNGIFQRVMILIDSLYDYGGTIIMMIGSLIYIGITNKIIFITCSIILIIGGFILHPLSKKTRYRRSESKKTTMEIDRLFIRWVMSKREILQNNQYYLEVKQDIKLNDIWLKQKNKEKTYQSIGFDGVQFLLSITAVIFVFLSGKQVIENKIPLDEFVLLFGLLQLFIQNSTKMIEVIRKMTDNRIHIVKLWQTFDNFTPILGYNTGKEFKHKIGYISFKNTSYGYNENDFIFDNFSLNIKGSTKTALVGPSGGGKSTLIKLIAGYLHPQSGEILVDNQALPTPQNVESGDHVSLQSYYPHIGYLTQEPSVFDGTIWENLTYGMTETQQDKDLEQTIDQVIKLSKCEFIYEFKDGLQTEIGEKGVRLSGGQRQRLAIAKIMLKNPSIILLDEPTSALDSYNEEQVTQALNNLFQGKTVIIIAHRLQTVKNADEILYIAKDEEANSSIIIERGTHAQLLELKGEYHTMVELQSGF